MLGVLISGSGSNLQSLIDNNIDISVVISSNKDAYGLTRCKEQNIDCYFENDEEKMIEILKSKNVKLVVLAGYLKIISKRFLENFTVINIHPSLIPSFCGKGFYGMNVHKKVYESGVRITGATVHFVDDGVDTGNIIIQKSCEVNSFDDEVSIQKKVLKIEHEILPKTVKLFLEDKIEVINNRVYIKGEKDESIN